MVSSKHRSTRRLLTVYCGYHFSMFTLPSFPCLYADHPAPWCVTLQIVGARGKVRPPQSNARHFTFHFGMLRFNVIIIQDGCYVCASFQFISDLYRFTDSVAMVMALATPLPMCDDIILPHQ